MKKGNSNQETGGNGSQLDASGKVRRCRGPVIARQTLIADLRKAIDERPSPFSPIWILTSSSAHRRELMRALPDALERPLLGVVIHTLHSAAHTILHQAGRNVSDTRLFFPWWLRREAANQPTLRAALGHLTDGYGAAARVLQELKTAGYHRGMLDAVEEALKPMDGTQAGRRTLALFQALSSLQQSPNHCIEDESDLLNLALDALQFSDMVRPQTFITGFMDATSAGVELLRALLEIQGSRVYLDFPPDPANARTHDTGVRFSEAFIGRMGHSPAIPELQSGIPALSLFEASGCNGEAFHLARRIRKLLDDGEKPEEIGVICRTLDGFRLPLTQAFDELGIPWSIPQADSPPRGLFRPFRGLLAILRNGEESAISAWIESASFPQEALRNSCSTSLRVLGLGCLGDWDSNRIPLESFALPVRWNWARNEEGDPRVHRERVASQWMKSTNERLRATHECLEAWPSLAPFHEHFLQMRRLAAEGLGWTTGDPTLAVLEQVIQGLENQPSPPLSRGEFATIAEQRLRTLVKGPRTEERGGVRILDATRARGLTFHHVFLARLNRGQFPRVISEDPLLPDDIRKVLQPLLPDLSLRGRGHDEERYLFAQLFHSAAHTTLSWQRSDDDGKELGRSVFVDRILLAIPGLEVERIPRDRMMNIRHKHPAASPLRTPRELAVVHALEARTRDLAPWLGLSLEDAGHLQPEEALELGRFRTRVLEEASPDKRTKEGRERIIQHSPFLGWVGPVSQPLDPRHRSLSVTAVEALAGCPWKFWLKRMLRLEQIPTPSMAPAGLPSNLLGEIVHDALENMIEELVKTQAPDWDGKSPVNISRPHSKMITRHAEASAEKCCVAKGVLAPALWSFISGKALVCIEISVNMDWPENNETIAVCGIEHNGKFAVKKLDGTSVFVSFRADRVDLENGSKVLTDYKTGKPGIDGVKEDTRRKKTLIKVSTGEMLQGMGYALGSPGSTGRYRYLKDGVDPRLREVTIGADDEELIRVFEETGSTLFEALGQGILFPRLEDPHGNSACVFCDVAEACSKNDSGIRERLRITAQRAKPRVKLSEDRSPNNTYGHLFYLGEPLPREEGHE